MKAILGTTKLGDGVTEQHKLPYSMIAMVENFFLVPRHFSNYAVENVSFVYTPFAEYFGIIQRLGSGEAIDEDTV